jgi:hypothetical protein
MHGLILGQRQNLKSVLTLFIGMVGVYICYSCATYLANHT